jgi:hypothetical protein
MTDARATIRIDPNDAERAALLAAALEPDNTQSMETHVTAGALETRIERDSVGGLRTTIDDYLCNLGVAREVARIASRDDDSPRSSATDATGNETDDDLPVGGETDGECDSTEESKRQE